MICCRLCEEGCLAIKFDIRKAERNLPMQRSAQSQAFNFLFGIRRQTGEGPIHFNGDISAESYKDRLTRIVLFVSRASRPSRP